MFLNQNFKNITVKSLNPVFKKGAGKLIAPLTFESIANSIIENGYETKEDLEKYLIDLNNFYKQKDSIISLPRFFYVWGQIN